ncbi:unnamed protein product [Paramecium primaurelia]|uniref:Transmembrane protein n=1 Tax=Paramecium primaurelia TaxID=5886 RepID=A0A8S1NHK7_PARPR|nr:unnamed protein product [Paramecium primaurelia]
MNFIIVSKFQSSFYIKDYLIIQLEQLFEQYKINFYIFNQKQPFRIQVLNSLCLKFLLFTIINMILREQAKNLLIKSQNKLNEF